MTIEAPPPSPQTTLIILLGASAWPEYDEFSSSQAFANAASGVHSYFLNQFGLPVENLLDLFDSEKNAIDQDREIAKFLVSRRRAMELTGNATRDVVLYFVGHGSFVGPDSEFFLAIRATHATNPRISGFQTRALADTLHENARHMRCLIILDCCFAAAAFRAFEAGPSEIAIKHTIDAFEVKKKGKGFPRKGVTLLCSSNHKTPSLLLSDGSSTMFSSALLDALSQGEKSARKHLSVRDVKELAEDILREQPNAPRPAIHSPDQSEGDIADIPFFPNPAQTDEPIKREEPQKEIRSTEKIETIQVNPDEGYEQVRRHLEKSTSENITLIIPEIPELRNRRSWSLLSALVTELSKEVRINSTDKEICKAASKAGFRTSTKMPKSASGLVSTKVAGNDNIPGNLNTGDNSTLPESGSKLSSDLLKEEKHPPQDNFAVVQPEMNGEELYAPPSSGDPAPTRFATLNDPIEPVPPAMQPLSATPDKVEYPRIEDTGILDHPYIITGNERKDPKTKDLTSGWQNPLTRPPAPPTPTQDSSVPWDLRSFPINPIPPDSRQILVPNQAITHRPPLSPARPRSTSESALQVKPKKASRLSITALTTLLGRGSRMMLIALGIVAILAVILIAILTSIQKQNPSSLLWFILIGLGTGLFSQMFTDRNGSMVAIHIIAGCIGAFIGGYATNYLIFRISTFHFPTTGNTFVAFIGACMLIVLLSSYYRRAWLLITGELALPAIALVFLFGSKLQPDLPWFVAMGTLSGFLAGTVSREGIDTLGNIVVGCIGACSGGYLASLIGAPDWGSISISFICASMPIALWRITASRRISTRRRASRHYASGTELILICGFLLLLFIFVFIFSLHQTIPFLAWLSIGMFPALITSMVIHRSGMDTIGNIITGGIGACGAGYLVNLIIPWPGIAFWVSIFVALIGACILLAIFRSFASSRY